VTVDATIDNHVVLRVNDDPNRLLELAQRAVRAEFPEPDRHVELLPTPARVFASVAAGNTRSLRAFLTAGFRPIGAECLLVDKARMPSTSDGQRPL
jgi:hypothetical protein